MLEGFGDKSAVALCTFGYCEGPGHEPIIFEGRTNVSDGYNASFEKIMIFFRVRSLLLEVQAPLVGMAFFSLMDLSKRKGNRFRSTNYS